MPIKLTKTLTALAVAAVAFAPLAAGVTALTVDAAYANPGKGNGNSNGSEKSNNGRGAEKSAANRAAKGDSGGRGAIASELGALNAAHANQKALENASPNSMPGKLFAYQETGGITIEGITDYNDAKAAKAEIEALTLDDLKAAYQDEYDAYVDGLEEGEEPISEAEFFENLKAGLVAAQDAIIDEYADAYAALAALKDGSLTLSKAALDELNAMLGVEG